MQFTLVIELGNDAMQTYADIREALQMVCKREGSPEDGDGNSISDANGNSVGTWNVSA